MAAARTCRTRSMPGAICTRWTATSSGPRPRAGSSKQVESLDQPQGPEDALLRPRRPGHAEARGVDPAARRRRHLPGARARRDRRHRVLDAQHGHRPRLLSGRQVQLLSRLAPAVLDRRAADEQGGLGGARRPEPGDSRSRLRLEHLRQLRRDRGKEPRGDEQDAAAIRGHQRALDRRGARRVREGLERGPARSSRRRTRTSRR